MSWDNGRHFIIIKAAVRSSNFTPGLDNNNDVSEKQTVFDDDDDTYRVVNAGDFNKDNINRGSSLKAVEQGRTPGWLMHCNIFHL